MSSAVDTSVVLRLLTGEPSNQAEIARRQLERLDTKVHVDALVVGESYFALRHHYQVPHVAAVDALLALLSSERLGTNPCVRDALANTRDTHEPGVMDRLILAQALGEDRELLTFDQRLARLEGARLVR
ncbi:PIN domain-containing protein [Gemmatimonas sp.]|uniref:PIN domain-containing protein n=1 Tax=Gemmatimonas sp. TaxID=1962908 RepID=UPI0025C6B39A|nr:PIN domain-containing protein [Gemmatimonas sp.]MCA2989846.1 PIN domain-containing protein [Gemmatimonas sp.]